MEGVQVKKYCLLLFFSIIAAAPKKILLLTSKGGGAHTAAAQAINECLGQYYQIDTVNAISDIFNNFNNIWPISSEFEQFYNAALGWGFFNIINFFVNIGKYVLEKNKDALKQKFDEFLKVHSYDAVISVMPAINDVVLESCAHYSLPFLLFPLDFDLNLYFLSHNLIEYDKFYICLPVNNNYLASKLKQLHIHHVFYTGFPLRRSFFEPKNKQLIRSKFAIPAGKKVVMILMGAVGSNKAYYYVKRLLQQPEPLHIIVAAGKNNALIEKIKKLKLPMNKSVTVVGFTDKISDLMAVSDVLITKSGPSSMFEAIASQVPVMIDATADLLDWEKDNMAFVEQNQLGLVLSDYRDFDGYLSTLLHNDISTITLTNFCITLKNIMKAVLT